MMNGFLFRFLCSFGVFIAWQAAFAESQNKNFEVKGFVPLWGDITLVQGTQVSGYLITDLPKDVTIRRLRWTSSDTVTINY